MGQASQITGITYEANTNLSKWRMHLALKVFGEGITQKAPVHAYDLKQKQIHAYGPLTHASLSQKLLPGAPQQTLQKNFLESKN
jgi:hypothetical protein